MPPTSALRRHGRPNSRRAVPTRPTAEQRAALAEWLQQDLWVLRPVWQRWLDAPDDRLKVSLDALTRNQHVAAREWLRQQRHALHDVVVGGPAPDGWLQAQPLYEALDRRLREQPEDAGR